MRHYTSASGLGKIEETLKIVARDQNCVFMEPAALRRMSPGDAEDHYGLGDGRGNATVEFDVDDQRVQRRRNRRMGVTEWFIAGDIALAEANPTFERKA